MAEEPSYRLPRTAWPTRYRLELAPDLGRSVFEGSVRVNFDVVEPIHELVLNAAELSIDEVTVRTPDGRSSRASVSLDEQEQTARIALADELPAGSGYEVELRFAGAITEHLRGLYRSTFVSDDGTEHVIASTQFEPADARRLFPCWDEPEFKATFALTLIVDETLVALANEAAVSDEPAGDGRRRVTFAETMPMSTYLVAFVLGPFDLSDPVDAGGVPLRVAVPPGKLHLARYAERVGSHALRFLSQYFDIPYPGGKIDHVAIPNFAFGAMENLGCVTYRENALLVDPAVASQLELQRVATVIAHETAHMWFGNLVTMKWWDGIWLNEAFATFMELATTDAFHPAWQVWTSFGAAKEAALATDALRSSRPVEFSVGRPEEAEAMFDVLTYQKGGSVLRMLEQYLGPETFRKGISHYLSVHAHANTETTDLWDAIEEVSGEPVRAIMDSWIRQAGYPLVTVEEGPDPASIRLRQSRFLYDRSGAPPEQSWGVPVNMRASVGGRVQRQRLLLDGDESTVSFDEPVDWIVVNEGAWGFYRVRYSPNLLGRLAAGPLGEVCHPLERLGLVVDVWASVVAGEASLADWAAVVGALGEEIDPDVWSGIVGPLELLDLVADERDREALRAFARRTAGPVWERLGWDARASETDRERICRGRVVRALGLVGADRSVAAEAAARLARSASDPGALAPDLLTPVAEIVVASGGEDGWNAVLQRYRQSRTPQDKVRYLFALSKATEPELLSRTLDMVLGAEVRTQDAPFVVQLAMMQRHGSTLAWEWLEQHWDDLEERVPNLLVARVVEGIPALMDADVAASVHGFTDTHDLPLRGPRLDQLLERMDINVVLAQRLRGTLRDALGA